MKANENVRLLQRLILYGLSLIFLPRELDLNLLG